MSSLQELAAAYNVDAEVWGWQGEHRRVGDDTLRAILAAFGVDTADDESCRVALARRRSEQDDRVLPP